MQTASKIRRDWSYLLPGIEPLKPTKHEQIDVWAEKNIILSELTCPEPGPMRLSRTPYVRGPLLAFNSLYIEWIVVVWGRQLGKSQGVQYTSMAYSIDQDPGPILFLLPSEKLAEYTSTNRIQPLLRMCGPVKEKISKNKDDFTTLEMKFAGSVLSLVGGGSSSQLMSRPVRYLFRDEIDELKEFGNDADPLKTVEETVTAFANSKIIDTSTPTTTDGNIWRQLKSCQYVFEFWVPCLHCGEYQILSWEQIKFASKESDREKMSRQTYYECEHCEGKISDTDKSPILEKGDWRARLSERPADDILDNERVTISNTVSLNEVLQDHTIKKIGFHLPKWYGAFYRTTFGAAAKEFLEANDKYKELGDYKPLRDWTKFWAAKPYRERVESKTTKEIHANIIDLDPLMCPEDSIALTAGIDQGQGGYWFSVLAWRRDFSPHLVHYGFLTNNEELRTFIWESSYQIKGRENEYLTIWRTGLDTGGSRYVSEDVTMTDAAYNWLREYGKGKVYGIKGISTEMAGKKMRPSIIDRTPKGKRIPGGLTLWLLDTGAFKDAISFRLKIEADKPGRFTLHRETGKDFISHLLAEEKRRNKKGKYEWVRTRKANHLLDCCMIAFAMADAECWGGVRISRRANQAAPEGDKQIKETGRWIISSGIKKGFVNRWRG